MTTSNVLKCIADPQRLRILNLLESGPLCVCHLQALLEANQVTISKQLATLKRVGLIQSKRQGTWMIYKLREPVDGLLLTNLCYLRQADSIERQVLNEDLGAREKLVKELARKTSDCPTPVCETITCC